MSKFLKAVLITGLTTVIGFLSLLDEATRFLPDLTILYLIPVLTATALAGLASGIVLAVFAAFADLYSNIRLGVDIDASLVLDAVMHFLVFALSVFVMNRLLFQLKTIRMFEQERQRDIAIAKELHKEVISPFPRQYKNIAIATKMIPAKELSGDYLHVRIGDSFFFCIGDISGKSIAAALFSALLNESLVAALNRSKNLTDTVRTVNSRLYSALPEVTFVTLFCGIVDQESIHYINAGHEPPLVFSSSENDIHLLRSGTTLPLGVSSDLHVEVERMSFRKNDAFLAVTDGVTESAGFRENPFEKLGRILRENAKLSPKEIVDAVSSETVEGSDQLLDDATFVSLKRL